MLPTTSSDPIERIDARPMRQTSDHTSWDKTVTLRDEFAAEVKSVLEGRKIDAAVFVSSNGEYPPWVRLEAWLPGNSEAPITAESRERAELVFVIDAKPYHEHDVVVSAKMARGRTRIDVDGRPDFPVEAAEEWVLYALDRGPKPKNYTPIKDTMLRAIPFVRGPHSNRLLKKYRTRFTGAMALAALSLIVIFFAFVGIAQSTDDPDVEPPYFALLALGLVGLVGGALWVKFRQRAVSVTEQSESPPRSLGLVDSWHAVVAELGIDFANIKKRLVVAIEGDASPGAVCQIEAYTHRAPNGYEQRERLVVFKDQGMVQIHIYQFGRDLFVGWYAYLNWAQWGETGPVGVKILNRREVEYRDLRPAGYVPNQFDLIDLSSLSEFVHRRLEREIKGMMKERDIDQEVDFKVIRGDPDRALDQERHAGEQKGSSWSYRS
jgi:hypothetical protein